MFLKSQLVTAKKPIRLFLAPSSCLVLFSSLSVPPSACMWVTRLSRNVQVPETSHNQAAEALGSRLVHLGFDCTRSTKRFLSTKTNHCYIPDMTAIIYTENITATYHNLHSSHDPILRFSPPILHFPAKQPVVHMSIVPNCKGSKLLVL